MKTNVASESGFTLTELMIIVSIIGLLAAIGIPNYLNARQTSQTNLCINNLRQMDNAVQQWALDTRKLQSATYALTDIYPYLKMDSHGNPPACPASGIYTPGANVGSPPTCTIPGHVLPVASSSASPGN